MDIVGYVFWALAVIFLIAGLSKGFTNTLLGLLTAVGSIAVAALLTPTVSQLDFVQNLLEDTPVVINGTEVFFVRTIIVFFVLFIIGLVAFLVIKGLFGRLLKRVKILKILDKILGATVNVVVVWTVFGVLFAMANAGTEWLVTIDEQLASTGIHLGLANFVGNLLTNFSSSAILQGIYSTFNPIGDLVGSMLFV